MSESSETKPKPRRTGVVTSDKMQKTRTVVVHRLVRHPLYRKYVRRRTILKVHDENETSQQGDRVEVEFAYEFENLTAATAFPGFFESVPVDAVNVVARDGSGQLLAGSTGEEEGFATWLVGFRSPLEPGDSLAVTLSWAVESGGSPSGPIVEPGAERDVPQLPTARGVEGKQVAVHGAAEDEPTRRREESGRRARLDRKLPAKLTVSRVERADGAVVLVVRLDVLRPAAGELLALAVLLLTDEELLLTV